MGVKDAPEGKRKFRVSTKQKGEWPVRKGGSWSPTVLGTLNRSGSKGEVRKGKFFRRRGSVLATRKKKGKRWTRLGKLKTRGGLQRELRGGGWKLSVKVESHYNHKGWERSGGSLFAEKKKLCSENS